MKKKSKNYIKVIITFILCLSVFFVFLSDKKQVKADGEQPLYIIYQTSGGIYSGTGTYLWEYPNESYIMDFYVFNVATNTYIHGSQIDIDGYTIYPDRYFDITIYNNNGIDYYYGYHGVDDFYAFIIVPYNSTFKNGNFAQYYLTQYDIIYGVPVVDEGQIESAYENGYDAGFTDGVNDVKDNPNSYDLYTENQYYNYGSSQYVAGQTYGETVGENRVINNPTNYDLYNEDQYNATNNITTFVASTFNKLSTFFNIEIFPNFTIGTFILLPLMLGIFLIILKLIK